MGGFVKKYPVLAMAIASIAFGLNVPLTKYGTNSIPPMLFAGVRFYIAGVALVAVGVYLTQNMKRIKLMDMVVQISLQLTVAVAWFWAISLTQAINAAVMFLITPFVVYVGSIVFLGEPRSNKALVGALIAFCGGILLFGAPALTGASSSETLGNGLLLLGAIAYAFLILHSKKVIRDENLFMTIGVRYFTVANLMLLIALVFEDPSAIISAPVGALAALIISGTIFGALSYFLFYKAFEYISAESSAPLIYLDPLAGALGGALVLGETLSPLAATASVIIIAGVLVSHPVHVYRYVYYHTYKHSRFEHFIDEIKHKFKSVESMLKRII